MAQKTEKEETEFKLVTETITPCINNCGVTGNPSTKNMCQKCFNSSSSSSSMIVSKARARSGGAASPRTSPAVDLMTSANPAREKRDLVEAEAEGSIPAKRAVNRCSGCRKKVGLTGFRCRCGELFCGEHRYSDRHECGFDYKLAGREAIARENPVVKAAKIVKI